MVDVYTIPCRGCNQIGQEGLHRVQNDDVLLARIQNLIPSFANGDYICAGCIELTERNTRRNLTASLDSTLTSATPNRLSTDGEGETGSLDASAKSHTQPTQQRIQPKVGQKSAMEQFAKANKQRFDHSSSSLNSILSSEEQRNVQNETDGQTQPTEQRVKPKIGPKSVMERIAKANQQRFDHSSSSVNSILSSEDMLQRNVQNENVPPLSEASSLDSNRSESMRTIILSQDEIQPIPLVSGPARKPFFPTRAATARLKRDPPNTQSLAQPGLKDDNNWVAPPSPGISNSVASEDSFDRLVGTCQVASPRNLASSKPGTSGRTIASPPSFSSQQKRLTLTVNQPVLPPLEEVSSVSLNRNESGSGSDMDSDDMVPLNLPVKPSKQRRMRTSPPRRALSPLTMRDVGNFTRNNAG